ncbi:hypothetical protein AtDm6_0714 [Acetobacter tropicalis]|uniref:Uncharacterized protein n=1 Tax=Acetobacter tropicalis TaxID=104102 RepID=A0A094YXT6_9PROT|nr:hypothetical protein AtDm6_0714 [Acetobacter tropicalis]
MKRFSALIFERDDFCPENARFLRQGCSRFMRKQAQAWRKQERS